MNERVNESISRSILQATRTGNGFNKITRCFTKRNWVAFVIVNNSELEKGNGELYMAHGNLNITMVYLRYS